MFLRASANHLPAGDLVRILVLEGDTRSAFLASPLLPLLPDDQTAADQQQRFMG